MTAKINFLHKASGNYGDVERSLFGEISQHLPTSLANPSYDGEAAYDAVNMALFFGRGGDVFMSHGVADKNYMLKRGTNRRLLLNDYQAVFVPGPWMKRKLLANKEITLKPEQIIPVGWPRLDGLLRKQKEQPPKANNGAKLKVLWAPTHDAKKHGATRLTTSSYPLFNEFTAELGSHVDLSIGLHPRNRTDKTPTAIGLLEADVIISDFGTMVYEAWALGKPVIFPYWLIGEAVQQYRPGSAEAHIFSKKIGYHPNSFEEMLNILKSPMSITKDVKDFMEDYLPKEFLGTSGKTCADSLAKISESIREDRAFKLFHENEAAKRAEGLIVVTQRREAKETARLLKSQHIELTQLRREVLSLRKTHADLNVALKAIYNPG